jgi:hypothetical protein
VKLANVCIACGSERLARLPAVLAPFVAARVFGWEPVTITQEWGLRDILPGQAYSLCNSVACDACEMLFLDMRFDDEEMGKLYGDYRGAEYCSMRERFEPGYSDRNSKLLLGATHIEIIEDFIRRYLPIDRPRILDWGGDSGINTPFRYSAACIDVFDISNRPLVSEATAVTRSEIVPSDYDLIVFSQVLEHVSWPVAALQELASVMTDDALLYVELPYENIMREAGPIRSKLAAKRLWHEHINFFSEMSLNAVFRAANLRIVGLSSHEVATAGAKRHVFSVAARL